MPSAGCKHVSSRPVVALVREQKYTYVGPVSVLVRSYDLPHTITAMAMDTAAPQAAGKNPGLGMLYGASISGSITDSTGR